MNPARLTASLPVPFEQSPQGGNLAGGFGPRPFPRIGEALRSAPPRPLAQVGRGASPMRAPFYSWGADVDAHPLDYISICTGGGMILLRRAHDLTGRAFGKLTAVKPVGIGKFRSVMWACSCSCGGEITTTADLLKRGSTVSCGCRRSEAAKENMARNGGPWNLGATYQIRTDDEVFRSLAAWRNAAIRTRGNACEICGWAEASCDVHHRIPRRDGGRNTVSNAVVLCPNHHRIAHQGEEE